MNLAPRIGSVFVSLALPAALAFCGGKATIDPGTSGGSGGATGTSTVGTTVGISVAVTSTGSGPGFDAACGSPGTCVLAQSSCCGVCGTPSLADFDAIHEGAEDAHRNAVCPVPQPCPGCPSQQNPNLFAYCDLGTGFCQKADLPSSKFAACNQASDCTLRLGLGCCDCGPGAGSQWVAVAGSMLGELVPLLCKNDTACADCVANPPPDIKADCLMGRCVVSVLGG